MVPNSQAGTPLANMWCRSDIYGLLAFRPRLGMVSHYIANNEAYSTYSKHPVCWRYAVLEVRTTHTCVSCRLWNTLDRQVYKDSWYMIASPYYLLNTAIMILNYSLSDVHILATAQKNANPLFHITTFSEAVYSRLDWSSSWDAISKSSSLYQALPHISRPLIQSTSSSLQSDVCNGKRP